MGKYDDMRIKKEEIQEEKRQLEALISSFLQKIPNRNYRRAYKEHFNITTQRQGNVRK